MVDLPDADALFKHYFAPWYRPEDLRQRGFDAVLPDMLEFPDDRGAPPERLTPLNAEGRDAAMHQIHGLIASATADFPRYLPVGGDPSLHWLDAFDDYWNPDRIAELIGQSEPADFANDYFVTTRELGALLGHLMLAAEPHTTWLPNWPYWDSGIWDPSSAWVINPFHWAIKRMSHDGFDEKLSDKTPAVLKMMRTARPKAAP